MHVELKRVLEILDQHIASAHNNIERPIPHTNEILRLERFAWQARLSALASAKLDILETLDPGALRTPGQDEDQGDQLNTAPGDVGARDAF